MKNFLLLAALFSSVTIFSQDVLYDEGFESFAVGDFVSSSPVWSTWANAPETAEDAQISDEQAHEGSNSLKIYQTAAAGGPMDVMMVAGLDGDVYDVSFWMYIPTGFAGYYNIQENQEPGIGWAFEAAFATDGTMSVVSDMVEVASGTFPMDTWFQMSHLVDMDSDNVTLSIDGASIGSFLFDSAFGGINFYGVGDGVTNGTYYIDDLTIATAVPSSIASPETLSFNFGPNPASNYINIQGQPADAMLKIHALNGQLVVQQRVSGIDRGQRILLNLDNGIYFVELSNGTTRSTQRLLIQH
jgi:hypothetical protein